MHATIPEEGSVSINWAYGSCQFNYADEDAPIDSRTGKPLQKAWEDLAGPDQYQRNDILWDTGDFHYEGGQENAYGQPSDWTTWAKMYWQQIQGLDYMRRARALVAEDQVADDHEFSKNNGESLDPPSTAEVNNDLVPYIRGPERAIQMVAQQNLFATQDIVDDTKGLYGSYMLTPHVRVILLDCASLRRTWSGKTPSSARSFLGADQTTWLKTLPTSGEEYPTVNLLIASKAWIGSNMQPPASPYDPYDLTYNRNRDKVWMYGQWRSDFRDWLNGLSGKKVNLVWLGGDRHYCCWDEGGNNSWGDFPCLVGSGWSHTNLQTVPGEAYRYMQPLPASHGNQVMQYLCGSIRDFADGTVELTTTIRYYDFEDEVMKSVSADDEYPMFLNWTNPNAI